MLFIILQSKRIIIADTIYKYMYMHIIYEEIGPQPMFSNLDNLSTIFYLLNHKRHNCFEYFMGYVSASQISTQWSAI